ncbi:MAG: hypothetical protein QOH05_850, partial [Acetobacteraceae bacterium]|nr:hypothetical protein [Acetobacteraceae bacterium]
VLGIALSLAGCTGMPASPAASGVSSNNGYEYPSVSTSSGSGNAYNWLEGGD